MKNKYIYRSRISEKKFREILHLFCLDIQAKKVAKIASLNKNTIGLLYDKIRQTMAKYCEQTSPFLIGEIEVDESYFGANRVRGQRGRGASGKTAVFGMLKRAGKVYTQIVKNCSLAELMPVLRERASQESTIYSDGWRAYDGLVDLGDKRHYRVKHGQNEFVKGANPIHGIENFWGLS